MEVSAAPRRIALECEDGDGGQRLMHVAWHPTEAQNNATRPRVRGAQGGPRGQRRRSPEPIPGRYIAILKPQLGVRTAAAGPTVFQQVSSMPGARLRRTFGAHDAGLHAVSFEVPANDSGLLLLAKLRSRPDVEWVQQDYRVWMIGSAGGLSRSWACG